MWSNDADCHISILGHLWLSTPQDGGFSGMIYNTGWRTSPEYLLLQVDALQKTIRKEISLESISLNWNEGDTSCDHCRTFAASLASQLISGQYRSLSKWEDAHPVMGAVLENIFSFSIFQICGHDN